MKKFIAAMLAALMLVVCGAAFADAEQVYIVGTNPEFPPFEFVGDDGAIQGIDVDIINEISKDIGVAMEVQAMDFDALVPSLVSGKIDVSIAGMTITEDRKKSVLFSEPYFAATQVVVVKIDSPITTGEELKGKKIGVQLGTTGDLMMSEPAYADCEISRFNKGMDAILDLQAGRLDAVVIDTLPALQFVAGTEDLMVLKDALNAKVENYGIAVAMDNTELMDKINASLARIMSDGTFDAIIAKYTTEEDEAQAGEAIAEAVIGEAEADAAAEVEAEVATAAAEVEADAAAEADTTEG